MGRREYRRVAQFQLLGQLVDDGLLRSLVGTPHVPFHRRSVHPYDIPQRLKVHRLEIGPRKRHAGSVAVICVVTYLGGPSSIRITINTVRDRQREDGSKLCGARTRTDVG